MAGDGERVRGGWRPYSEAEAALIRQLYAEGVPDREVGARIGRTAQAVRDWRARHGVTGRPRRLPNGKGWRVEEEARLRALFDAGAEDGAIAAELGRTVGSVARRRRDMGLLRPPRRGVPVFDRAAGWGRGRVGPGMACPLRLPRSGGAVVPPDDCVLAERAMLAVMQHRRLPHG